MLIEQLAELVVRPTSVQVSNPPHERVPEGVVGDGEVSVTVPVHDEGWLTVTVLGLQLALVVVVSSGVTVRLNMPALPG